MIRSNIEPDDYTDDAEVVPPASEQALAHRLWREYVAERLQEMEPSE